MRAFIAIMENANLLDGVDPALINELRAEGFDLDHLLFHGSNALFDRFDPKKVVTADHLYTSPDPDTAGYYGKYLYLVAGRQDPQADLIDDWALIGKLAETFADDFYDAVETDEDLGELAESLKDELRDQFETKTREENPDIDDSELENLIDDFVTYELDDAVTIDPRYKKALHRTAKNYVAEMITSGELYGVSSQWQDTIMQECFGNGYNSVRFFDPSSTGSPISVVFDDPNNLEIIKRLR